MRTKLWLVLPLVIASIALAQNGNVQGSKGEGVARSEDNRIGKFLYDVSKFTRPNGESVVEGRIRFESESRATNDHPGRHVLIEGKARHFGRVENVAEFGGPGLLVVRTNGEVVRKEGTWNCRVVDNRRPLSNEGRPDQFKIRFNVANSDAFYEFAGAVVRGDLVVFGRRLG